MALAASDDPARGLVAADWYHSDIPHKDMKALMSRSDQPAIRDTILWIALLVATATAGILLWGTWGALPFWLAYGVLYGSASDARWHECGRAVFCTDGLCTHEQVHLADGLVMDDTIECPRHNGRFNYKTGAALRTPACVALATYPARLNAGRIEVQV